MFRSTVSNFTYPSSSRFHVSLRGRANSARIIFAQKTFRFRWFCFSQNFSLLMSAFSILIPPSFFPKKLLRFTECSATPSFYGKTRIRWFALVPFHLRRNITFDKWAGTLSFKDGCFQAYLLVVFVISLPSHLANSLEPYSMFWAVSLSSMKLLPHGLFTKLYPFWSS